MSLEQRLFTLSKAHWKMLDRSEVRIGHFVCTPTKNVVFVHVLDIFRLSISYKVVSKVRLLLKWFVLGHYKVICLIKTRSIELAES